MDIAMISAVTKVTLAVLVGLAAVFGFVVGLSVVSDSLTPLIGLPGLAIAAAVALAAGRGCTPAAEQSPSRDTSRRS